MSITLDRILVQAADQYPETVTLSPEDVTVLLFAMSFLDSRRAWLDEKEDPLDEITTGEWDTIEKLVAGANRSLMTPILGTIFPYITENPPENSLPCDGGTYARTDYPLLYDLLDAAFIIDADNFSLPDLRARVPVGAGSGFGLSTYAVNEQGGQENVSLDASQNGAHSHGLFQSTGLAVAPGELPVVIPFALAVGSTDSSGVGAAHENRQPFVALNYAVVAL